MKESYIKEYIIRPIVERVFNEGFSFKSTSKNAAPNGASNWSYWEPEKRTDVKEPSRLNTSVFKSDSKDLNYKVATLPNSKVKVLVLYTLPGAGTHDEANHALKRNNLGTKDEPKMSTYNTIKGSNDKQSSEYPNESESFQYFFDRTGMLVAHILQKIGKFSVFISPESSKIYTERMMKSAAKYYNARTYQDVHFNPNALRKNRSGEGFELSISKEDFEKIPIVSADGSSRIDKVIRDQDYERTFKIIDAAIKTGNTPSISKIPVSTRPYLKNFFVADESLKFLDKLPKDTGIVLFDDNMGSGGTFDISCLILQQQGFNNLLCVAISEFSGMNRKLNLPLHDNQQG